MTTSEWSSCPCVRGFPCQLFNLSSSRWSGCNGCAAGLCFHWVTIKLPQFNIKFCEVQHKVHVKKVLCCQFRTALCWTPAGHIKPKSSSASNKPKQHPAHADELWASSKWPPALPNSLFMCEASVKNSVFTSPAWFGSESVGLKLPCAEASGNSAWVWPEDYARFSRCLFIVKLIKNIRVFAS